MASGLTDKLSDMSVNDSMSWDYNLSDDLLNSTKEDVMADELKELGEWHNKMSKFYIQLQYEYETSGQKAAYQYQQMEKSRIGVKPKAVTFTLKGAKSSSANVKWTKLEDLKGMPLLDELKLHIPNQLSGNVNEEVTVYNETVKDAQTVSELIVKGKQIIDKKYGSVLKNNIQLGLWLQQLLDLDSVLYKTTVEDGCNFKMVWARNLRAVARVFGKFAKLQNLSLPITVAMKISNKVDNALATNFEAVKFWL